MNERWQMRVGVPFVVLGVVLVTAAAVAGLIVLLD
jgi:hypothetical protein